jgi:hypothetical protein
MEYKYIFAAVAIIIIIYYLLTYNTSTFEQYMYGLWSADSDFCNTAGISSMLLFIGPAINGWFSTSRAGYIIIADDISNQPLSIDYTTGYGMLGHTYTINAKFKFDIEDIFECGDNEIKMTFDMLAGSLKIYSNDKVYAKLYKQNDISNLFAVDAAVDDAADDTIPSTNNSD